MAVPSAPNVYIGGNHKWGSDGVAAITTTPSESVTKVTAIISQTSGGAAIETVETSTKTSSDQFADRWALSWPTEDITSSPYYVRVRSTNADGNGPFKEIAPYIYFPPTVAVTAPVNGSTLTSASVTVAWTASDPYGISAQRVTVLHGADVLLDESVSESATSYAVPSSVAFVDGESYTFRVTARNGNGMEASANSTCAFSFDAPAAASVTIADDGATATITVDDPHYSESGSIISVDGSAIADSFTVFGASVQDGTPTPSAPVEIQSVEAPNILPPTVYNTAVAGSTIAGNANCRSMYCAVEPNTRYTVGRETVEGNRFRIYWTSTEPVSGVTVRDLFTSNDSATSVSVITPAQAKWIYIYLANDGSTITPNNVRVAKGIVSQIPPDGSIALETVGKNLFSVNGAHYDHGSFIYAYEPMLKPNTEYTCSSNIPQTTTAAVYFGGSITATNGVWTGRPVTATTDANGDVFIGVRFNAPSGSVNAYQGLQDGTYWLQLEEGTAATEYVPYEGDTYTIDLQGNALRSLPDGTRDELRVGERVTLVKRCAETLQAVTDGVTGTVGVDVLSSTGQIANGVQVVYKLAAPQEIDLGAVSDLPFIPEDGEMWVDGTTMEAVLRPADYAGQPTISSVDIARVNPDGTWTLAQGVAESQSAIDPLPPLGVEYRYALTSHAAGGGTKVAYAEHTVETRAWHLNFGDAAQEHVSYLYNPQATMTLAQGGESYHFADGGAGRGLPVFYPTTDRDMSGTLKFDTVLYGDSDILLDLCDRYPVAWLRDPFGHRWRAHVRPSVSHGVGQVWPVTISWDAVRFEEA